MSYDHPIIGRIKLTVGVRNRTLDKIQYGITAILENETVVPVTESKKKAPQNEMPVLAPEMHATSLLS